MLLTGGLVAAATITSQTTGGNWSAPATWVGGVMPAATDDVIIVATNATPVVCDTNATCARLTVNANCQLNISDNTILTSTGSILNGSPGTITTGAGISKLLLAGTTNQILVRNGIYGNVEVSNLFGYVQTPIGYGMTIAPGCTLTVDSGAYLQQGNPSQDVIGNGNFLLDDGASLGIKDPGGITSSDTNGYISVTGTRSFSTYANYIYNGTNSQVTGSGLPATVSSLTVSNGGVYPANVVTLTSNVTVSGATMIRDGTLALSPTSALVAGASIDIAAGATLDVSGLGASATYTLGGSATLTASGTNTVVGTSAAAINGGASGTINLGSQPITLTYDGSHPALYISQGTLSLNGNAFAVNTASPLTNGTYTIIQQAGGNIASNGIFSVSGTAMGLGTSGSIQVSGGNVNLIIAPLSLAITSVNGGVNPTAGTGFSVTVQAQGAGGTPFNVVSNTTVTLSLTTGTGTLGGTLTGTILAGGNSLVISGITYTRAESGVVLTATRTGGDVLLAGNSVAFTINAGAAAALILTSGSGQSGSVSTTLASPFVVTVTDANGNPVGGRSVTFAIATVPAGATGQSLSITNATTAANGQASSTMTLGSSNGTYTVTATSAGLSGSPVTLTATAAVIPATQLAITQVNGGLNPTAGTGFSVVVQAQDSGNTPQNVTTNTTVTISLNAGTGILGGTLTGTIPAGNNSVTISGVTYTKAESGVVLTATRTSGNVLTAGNSATFTVNAGAATTLALISGNSQSSGVGTALANPFVVIVTDANGNPVSGRSVTFAIATVPVGATGQLLSITNATTAANGQASSTMTLGSSNGTYTVTATSAGLNGSPVTFTARATDYTPLSAATYEYQICFKCHTAYAWRTNAPPNGNSPNGTAANPVMTDVAQEFSPMNKSGHPIVTGLDNYSNSIVVGGVGGKRGLLAAAMKAPWNVNVGQQTMMCSDCHDATTTNYVASAAQGPHGSANQFILRGPNAANWPNVTSFATSWCANCHNDNVIMDGHANHNGAGGCNTCHIIIPHGGKMSRLIADADGNMPGRYALNSTVSTTTVKITSFTKWTNNYPQGNCRVNCGHHSSGSNTNMENW